MPHWQDRSDPGWTRFPFKQPYARGLERLRERILPRPDFDPAVLWQWGTMQAMAVVEILKDAEERWGAEGQALVRGALRKVGLDVGRQILDGVEIPPDLPEAEVMSYYATVVNRIAYASLEAPSIEGADRASFHIVWCPHQDHYGAMDCRVQRYFVQGMIDALREHAARHGRDWKWEVAFTSTIPAGSPTCHFQMWRSTSGSADAWERDTREIETRALAAAERRKAAPEADARR